MEGGQCAICQQSPSEFACSCVFPAFLVCSACLTTHFEAAGEHSIAPVPAPGEQLIPGNEVCDDCQLAVAVRFCLCTQPLRKFCQGCDIAHYQKRRGVTHSMHPISAYEPVTSGRVQVEAFRSKQLYINDFQLRFWDELVQFDAFMRQVDSEFTALIAQITARKAAVLRDMQAIKDRLTVHLNEIQHTIESKRYIESFEVVTVLDECILRGYQSVSIPNVKLFTGKLELQAVYGAVERGVTYRTVDSLLQQEAGQIPVLKGHILRLFDRNSFQMAQMPLSQITRIDYATAYCFLTPNTLLAVGGMGHGEVYEINIRTAMVTRTANMNSNRWWTGVYPYRGLWVFVFGGSNGNFLNSAEKYALGGSVWTKIRNFMQKAKICCSVCEHLNGLYISGMEQKGSSIECFYPIDETFRLFRSDSVPVASIICCVEDKLYVIRQNKVEFADLANGSAVIWQLQANFPPINNGQYWLCCPVKVQRGELVSVLNPGGAPFGFFRFKPAQGLFTQVANFEY